MRFGDVTNYGSFDQRQTEEFVIKPDGDISKHFSIGYTNNGEIRYNTSIDRLEGHIRNEWSPFILLDDFSQCGGSTDDVIGQFVGACLNQCEYFGVVNHTSSVTSGTSSHVKTYDLFATIANENGLDLSERQNFAIQPYLTITTFSTQTIGPPRHLYRIVGGQGWIEPITTNRYSPDFGKFNMYYNIANADCRITWSIIIIANRMDAFKIECVDGTPPPAPPPPPDPIVFDITENRDSFDVEYEVVAAYPLWNRVDPLNVVINIHSGVSVYGSDVVPGIKATDLPDGSTITINNDGNIIGSPGDGGNGGGYVLDPTKTNNVSFKGDLNTEGLPGGTAILTRYTTTINNTGTIAGGAGGGGGSNHVVDWTGNILGGTGGSGGASGGVGGSGGSSWENAENITFEGDPLETTYDGVDGYDSVGDTPGGYRNNSHTWTLWNDELTPVNWINPSFNLNISRGGRGGNIGEPGEAGFSYPLPAMGVVLWEQGNFPVDGDTLTIGSDVFTFRHCPTDVNTCWDGSTRTRDKDNSCKFFSCPMPPELKTFNNKTDSSDQFHLQYEALRHVDNNPAIPLTDAEKAKNLKQGFLHITWDPTTDFSNVNEKVVVSVEGDDADMFEISATGDVWSSSIDWTHNSTTKIFTGTFYIRGKPVGDIDDARMFYADLSVSAFGLKKKQILECELEVVQPSPVVTTLSWDTQHVPSVSDLANFDFKNVFTNGGLTWDQAKLAAETSGGKLVSLDSQSKMNLFLDWYDSQNLPETWIGLDTATGQWVNGSVYDTTVKPVRLWQDAEEPGLGGKVSIVSSDDLNDYIDTHLLNYYLLETVNPDLDFEWVDGQDTPTGKINISGRFFQNTGVRIEVDDLTLIDLFGNQKKSLDVIPGADNTLNTSVNFTLNDITTSTLGKRHEIRVSWDDPQQGRQSQTLYAWAKKWNKTELVITPLNEPHTYEYIYKNGPSDMYPFEIRGKYLTSNINTNILRLDQPTDSFEISVDSGSTWSASTSISVDQNPQVIHIRMRSGLEYTPQDGDSKTYEGALRCTNTAADDVTYTLTGQVLSCPGVSLTYTYDQPKYYDLTFDDMLESGVVKFDMFGGAGGSGGTEQTTGLLGGRGIGGFRSTGEFTVNPGDVLRIQTGQGGKRGKNSATDSATGLGGWSGIYTGGAGGVYRSGDNTGGGGGGGASAIYLKPNNESEWQLIADAPGGSGGSGAYKHYVSGWKSGIDGVIDYKSTVSVEDILDGLSVEVVSKGFSYDGAGARISAQYKNQQLYSDSTGRSYQMIRMARNDATGEWSVVRNPSHRNHYDVYISAADAETLKSDIEAFSSDKTEMIIMSTNDEPARHRSVFWSALSDMFGVSSTYETLEHRGAYILVALRYMQDGVQQITRIHEMAKSQFDGTNRWQSSLSFNWSSAQTGSGENAFDGLGGGGASTTIGGSAGTSTYARTGASAGRVQPLPSETSETSGEYPFGVNIPLSPNEPINHAANYRWYESSSIETMPGSELDQSSFTRNGHAIENSTFIGAGPYGRQTMIWRSENKDADWRLQSGTHAYPGHISAGDGGWNKYISNLDPDKHYMSLVYVRRPDSYTGGSFYHGTGWNTTMNMDGSVNGNPYFSSFGQSNFAEGVWYLSVGFIWSKNTTTSLDSSIGGCYNLQTGGKLADYRDFRMLSSTQYHRTYQFYSGSRTPEDDTFSPTKIDWAHPGFFQIDEVPTLDELLNGKWSGIQGSFDSSLTPSDADGADGRIILNFDCCKIDSACLNTVRSDAPQVPAPTISLIGDTTLNWTAGGTGATYADPGYNTTNGSYTNTVVKKIVGGRYSFQSDDPTTISGLDLGTYLITHYAVNSLGVVAYVNRTLNVRDVANPTISLIGDATMNITTQQGFIDPGATATDEQDGDLTSSIVVTDNIDYTRLDTYTVTYTVSDAAGNTSSTTRSVVLTDDTPPVITLNGDSSVIHEATQAYDDAGATAIDNIDGDISNNIVTTSNVDINTPGIYNVTYTAEDNSGNSTTVSRVVQVRDTVKPKIELTGDTTHYVLYNSTYTDPGYVGTDVGYSTGGLTDQVTKVITRERAYNQTEDNVILETDMTTMASVYTIKYDLTDASGNVADTQTRTVIVEPTYNITSSIDYVGYDTLNFRFNRSLVGGINNPSETHHINGVSVQQFKQTNDNSGRYGLSIAHVGLSLYIENGSGAQGYWLNYGDDLPQDLRGLICSTSINSSEQYTMRFAHETDVYLLRSVDQWWPVDLTGWSVYEEFAASEVSSILTDPVAGDQPIGSVIVYKKRFSPGDHHFDDRSALYFFNPINPNIDYKYEISTSDTEAGFDAGVVQTLTYNQYQPVVTFENLTPYTFYACRLTIENNN